MTGIAELTRESECSAGTQDLLLSMIWEELERTKKFFPKTTEMRVAQMPDVAYPDDKMDPIEYSLALLKREENLSLFRKKTPNEEQEVIRINHPQKRDYGKIVAASVAAAFGTIYAAYQYFSLPGQ